MSACSTPIAAAREPCWPAARTEKCSSEFSLRDSRRYLRPIPRPPQGGELPRLSKRYFRRWRFETSRNLAQSIGFAGKRRLFNIPLYVFPQFLRAVVRMLWGRLTQRRDEAFNRENRRVSFSWLDAGAVPLALTRGQPDHRSDLYPQPRGIARAVLDPSIAPRRPPGGAEILAVANACTDNTHALLDAYAKNPGDRLPLRWIAEPTPASPTRCNRAIPEIGTRLTAFVDDDHRVDENYLVAIEAAANKWPDAGLYCGRILPDWDGTEQEWVHDEGPYRIYPLPVPRSTTKGWSRERSRPGMGRFPAAEISWCGGTGSVWSSGRFQPTSDRMATTWVAARTVNMCCVR